MSSQKPASPGTSPIDPTSASAGTDPVAREERGSGLEPNDRSTGTDPAAREERGSGLEPNDRSTGTDPVDPWECVSETQRGDYRVFRVRERLCRSPRSQRVHNFFVLDCPAWVNVIPITPDGLVVMVRQYRIGIGRITLEVPGGMADPGENPAEAGARELLEETGFTSDPLRFISRISPNPAIQSNYCYTYIAPNARFEKPPHTDSTEEIEVVLIPRAELAQRVAAGEIEHSLVVVAIYALELYERGLQWRDEGDG